VAEAVPEAEVDISKLLESLAEKTDLSGEVTEQALTALLSRNVPVQTAAFLVLLRAKGETADEVAGLAKAMLQVAIPVHAGNDVLDIVGTGGDNIGSVNISTGACVVAAAAGGRVAKHGNRSVSSLCGSADVLEALGVAVDLGPQSVARCVKEAGVGFMYAPRYHPAMATVRQVRKELGVRTAFNILGPMLNPARAAYGLIGVYSNSIGPLMAEALQRLGMERALVVHSFGLDELTPLGATDVLEVTPAGTRQFVIDPLDLGIPRCEVADLAGGDAAHNARLLMDVFGGERNAIADALNLNAGVALHAAGLVGSPQEGVSRAQEAQRRGDAGTVLSKWIETSQDAARCETVVPCSPSQLL